MFAITVMPGSPGSAQLEQLDEPERGGDELLVEMIHLSVWSAPACPSWW